MAPKFLKKESTDLYLEEFKDRRPFKWEREPEFILASMISIDTGYSYNCDRPESGLYDTTVEKSYQFISGVADITDSIHIIKKDGSVFGPFREIEIVIKPMQENGKGSLGCLFRVDYPEKDCDKESRICAEFHATADQIERIKRELESSNSTHLHVGFFVYAFMSEMEKALSEPWMSKNICIEDGCLNKAFVTRINVTRTARSRPVEPTTENKWPANEPTHAATDIERIEQAIARLGHIVSSLSEPIAAIKVALYVLAAVFIAKAFL